MSRMDDHEPEGDKNPRRAEGGGGSVALPSPTDRSPEVGLDSDKEEAKAELPEVQLAQQIVEAFSGDDPWASRINVPVNLTLKLERILGGTRVPKPEP